MVLLKAAGVAGEMLQVHPRDMQEGKVKATADDIVCNLPYASGCGLWFDHHISEEAPERTPASFKGTYALAPSAARLVYNYFVGDHPELKRFEPLLQVIDRFDSANLTLEDVKNPSAAMLLAYIADPRTGLGYYHEYRISNKQLTDMLPDLLLKHTPEEILQMPDVQERVERYHKCNADAVQLYRQHSRADGNVLITDFRGVGEIPPANRFLVYTLPGMERTNVSVRLSDVKKEGKVSIQVGHNIFNRTCKTNVGALCAEYGGGGHRGAGTCQVPVADAERVVREIVGKVKQ
jgi:hypothetical protein